jgi:outer membrane biosynthesis protein TonB
MRVTAKYALWLLTPLVLVTMQGCDKKTPPQQSQTLAPPIVDTPPPKPVQVAPADLPPPVVGTPQPATPPDTTPKPADTQKKPVHHVKKPAPTPAQTPTETASNGTAPSVSAVGQLSDGSSGDMRAETVNTINQTEKGVNGITRKLSDSETKTAAQIREFLKQAREALTNGDVDGAHTLAMKAKVLLAELNQ